ncbi:MAG: hypothetical protein GY749_16625 [Desulfobacteraceae bacterium]|nr:hypothetical protein [Desulfobacteraceae bacterium]
MKTKKLKQMLVLLVCAGAFLIPAEGVYAKKHFKCCFKKGPATEPAAKDFGGLAAFPLCNENYANISSEEYLIVESSDDPKKEAKVEHSLKLWGLDKATEKCMKDYYNAPKYRPWLKYMALQRSDRGGYIENLAFTNKRLKNWFHENWVIRKKKRAWSDTLKQKPLLKYVSPNIAAIKSMVNKNGFLFPANACRVDRYIQSNLDSIEEEIIEFVTTMPPGNYYFVGNGMDYYLTALKAFLKGRNSRHKIKTLDVSRKIMQYMRGNAGRINLFYDYLQNDRKMRANEGPIFLIDSFTGPFFTGSLKELTVLVRNYMATRYNVPQPQLSSLVIPIAISEVMNEMKVTLTQVRANDNSVLAENSSKNHIFKGNRTFTRGELWGILGQSRRASDLHLAALNIVPGNGRTYDWLFNNPNYPGVVGNDQVAINAFPFILADYFGSVLTLYQDANVWTHWHNPEDRKFDRLSNTGIPVRTGDSAVTAILTRTGKPMKTLLERRKTFICRSYQIIQHMEASAQKPVNRTLLNTRGW